MSDMSPEQEEEAREASLLRAMAEPMPADLKTQVENLIEPHTINMGADHGDAMTCIRVAWPVIRDWLRDHPEDLAEGHR